MITLDMYDEELSLEEEFAEELKRLDAKTPDEIDTSEMPSALTLHGWTFRDGTPITSVLKNDRVKAG